MLANQPERTFDAPAKGSWLSSEINQTDSIDATDFVVLHRPELYPIYKLVEEIAHTRTSSLTVIIGGNSLAKRELTFQGS